MKHLWAWYGLMTISHDDETNWGTVAFCPFSSSPWPQKQQTMMNINFLLGLHVQFSKLPGYYGPTKTTNLSNCSAPITSSTKCHKTADTIQHDPPSVPRIYEYMIYSIYFKSMMYGWFLQHIDGAPKFYIKTKWRITFICMPAKNQRTYIYIYTHGMYDISDKIVTFLSNFTNSEHPMINGFPKDQLVEPLPGNDHISQASNPKPETFPWLIIC